jgi:hypothetical protein
VSRPEPVLNWFSKLIVSSSCCVTYSHPLEFNFLQHNAPQYGIQKQILISVYHIAETTSIIITITWLCSSTEGYINLWSLNQGSLDWTLISPKCAPSVTEDPESCCPSCLIPGGPPLLSPGHCSVTQDKDLNQEALASLHETSRMSRLRKFHHCTQAPQLTHISLAQELKKLEPSLPSSSESSSHSSWWS